MDFPFRLCIQNFAESYACALKRVLFILILISSIGTSQSFADSSPWDEDEAQTEKILKAVRSHACADRIVPNQTKQDHLEASECKECANLAIGDSLEPTEKQLKNLVVPVDVANQRNQAKRDLDFYRSSVFAESFQNSPSDTSPDGLKSQIKKIDKDIAQTINNLKSFEEELTNVDHGIGVLSTYPADGNLSAQDRALVNSLFKETLGDFENEISHVKNRIAARQQRIEFLKINGAKDKNEIGNLLKFIAEDEAENQKNQVKFDDLHQFMDSKQTREQLGDKLDWLKTVLNERFDDKKGEQNGFLSLKKMKEEKKKNLEDLLAIAIEKAKNVDHKSSTAESEELKHFETNTVSHIDTHMPGFNPCGMSPAEVAAIQFYTGSGYEDMNRALREKNNQLEKFRPTVDVLKSALKKLRRYTGLVKRGSTLPPEVIASYHAGSVVTFNQFTSTSLSGGFNGNAKFLIQSKTGRYVGALSSVYRENEVLFAPQARFKILSRTDKSGVTEFVLQELDEKDRPGTSK